MTQSHYKTVTLQHNIENGENWNKKHQKNKKHKQQCDFLQFFFQ